jgi:hypothetical protein
MYKVLVTITVAFFTGTASYARFGDVVSSFPVPPRTGTDGLAWDGSYLWFCGQTIATFVRTTTKGSVVSSFVFGQPPTDYRGLTFNGEYLWFSEGRQSGGFTYHRLTTTGSSVGGFSKGYGDPGLAWEPPRYLWLGPFKVITTGSFVGSFKPPFYLGGDLAWYGHYLWTGGPTRDYYQLTTNGSVVASFPVPGGPGAGGTTFDGDYIWLVSGGNDWVYQIDVDVVGMNPGSFGKIKGLYR